jgi:hypothetical protein
MSSVAISSSETTAPVLREGNGDAHVEVELGRAEGSEDKAYAMLWIIERIEKLQPLLPPHTCDGVQRQQGR